MRTRVLVSVGALAFAPALLAPAVSRAADGVACVNAAERAQQLRANRKLVQARAELVKCSNAGCPRFVQTDCLRWLDELAAALPTIVIRAVDKSGSDVLDGTVLVDGDKRGSLGVGIELDPGPHTIGVTSASGADRGEVKLLVAEGEHNRVAVVMLGAPPKPEPPASVAPGPSPAPPKAHDEPAVPRGVGPWPFVAFGVGALGFIAFGALQIAAQNQYDDLERSCGHSCSTSDVDSVRTKVIGSAIGLGVGVLGAGAGVALLMLNRSSGPAVTVSPRSGGASADVVVRF